ncbi:hypothetical protein ADK74_04980 [Streptomyces decoyicus]|nr:hypothetical protein ADK74_04980 [Streptomyces decoyicus]
MAARQRRVLSACVVRPVSRKAVPGSRRASPCTWHRRSAVRASRGRRRLRNGAGFRPLPP